MSQALNWIAAALFAIRRWRVARAHSNTKWYSPSTIMWDIYSFPKLIYSWFQSGSRTRLKTAIFSCVSIDSCRQRHDDDDSSSTFLGFPCCFVLLLWRRIWLQCRKGVCVALYSVVTVVKDVSSSDTDVGNKRRLLFNSTENFRFEYIIGTKVSTPGRNCHCERIISRQYYTTDCESR